MNKELNNWILELNKQVNTSNLKIEELRQGNSKPLQMIRDLEELKSYMEAGNIPDGVKRSIEYCLKWNPFCSG